jgi:anti-sigma factor RsiW
MTCKDLENLATDYLEETLSSTRRQEFEVHLASCPKMPEVPRGDAGFDRGIA